MSTPDGDKSGTGGGTKIQPASSSAVVGSGATSGPSVGAGGGATGGSGIGTGTTTTATAYPIDLASASKVLVRPTEKTNMPTTYRIGNSAGNQMRVVIPSNAAPQTFYRHIKQDTTTNRTQINAIPAGTATIATTRPVTQTSITVSRPPQTGGHQQTTTYHVPATARGGVPATVTSIQQQQGGGTAGTNAGATGGGPRGATITAPIRIPTPPISVANLNPYVRHQQQQQQGGGSTGVASTRTSSPSTATIISQGGTTTTWMPGMVQVPTGLIRAASSIAQAPPRARVVAQTIPTGGAGGGGGQSANSSNNTGSGGSGTTGATITTGNVSTSSNQQTGGAGNQSQQTFVATLSPAVLPPQRQITSTLVYTNNSGGQPFSATTGTGGGTGAPQRLTLATTTLSPQRPAGVRPMQRLPTTANIGVRVTAGSINIRTPSVPVLAAPTTVLTTAGNRAASQVSSSSVAAASISNTIPARIIQVQNPQQGGQVGTATGGGRLPGNLLNIQPLIVSNNRLTHAGSTLTAPASSLTIAQVGKLTQVTPQGSGASSATVATGGNQQQQPQEIVVSSGGQVITGSLIPNPQQQPTSTTTTTVIPIPLAIAGNANRIGGGTNTTTIPVSVATLTAAGGGQNPISIVSGGIVRTTTPTSSSLPPSIVPIAKVTPQQLSATGLSAIAEAVNAAAVVSGSGQTPSFTGGTSLYIQTRPAASSASSSSSSSTIVTTGGAKPGTTFLPSTSSSTFYFERSSPAAPPVTVTSASSSTIVTSNVQPSQQAQVVVSSTGGLIHHQQVVVTSSSSLSSSSVVPSSLTPGGPVFSLSSSSGIPLSSAGSIITTSSSAGSSLPYAIVQTSSGRSSSSVPLPLHGLVSTVASSSSTPPAGATPPTVTATTTVPIRFQPQQLMAIDSQTGQQIIMTPSSASALSGIPTTVTTTQSAQPMIISMNSSTAASTSSASNIMNSSSSGNSGKVMMSEQQQVQQQSQVPVSSILRKRGLDQSPRSPIKITSQPPHTLVLVANSSGGTAGGGSRDSPQQQQQQQQCRDRREMSPPSRPLSTDGSTTVSATSSPGADQQEHEELKAMAYANAHADSMLPFKPLQEEIFRHHNSSSAHTLQLAPHPNANLQQTQSQQQQIGNNGGIYEQSPRKKPRKQNNNNNVSEGLKSVANTLQFYANSTQQSGLAAAATTDSMAAVATATASTMNDTNHSGSSYPSHRLLGDGGQNLPVAGVPVSSATTVVDNSSSSNVGFVVVQPNQLHHSSSSSSSSSSAVSAASLSALSRKHAGGSVTSAVTVDPAAVTSVSGNRELVVVAGNNAKLVVVDGAAASGGGTVRGASGSGSTTKQQAADGNGTTTTGATPKDSNLVRKARNVSLLESYKQSWKAANNHFQRYTDVKQREERRSTIVDIANQSHVLQKINGWKIYHLSAQIEDLCELESQAYDKLNQMLKTMETTPKPTAEMERINELLKGNMQRSKIIIDGINEARTQIMKIFDHKSHVSDIIQRCASKRNFKKRDKS